MKIDVNTSMFQRIFLDFALHVDSTILIRDENGLIVYSNTPLDTDQQMLLSAASDGEAISMNGASYQIHSYPVDGYPWNICIALSGRELDTDHLHDHPLPLSPGNRCSHPVPRYYFQENGTCDRCHAARI